MRILYVGMKYDYGKPEQGYSFEHYNFYDSLINMGHDIIYFDFMTLMQQHGKEWMNNKLLEVVKNEKPDLMFTVLFTEELDKKVVREISDNSDTVTFNWFCDDHWRFDNYSQYWAPCFNWVSTTAKSALPKYESKGYDHVIKSQWGCNPFLYRKMDLALKYDMTFIGQPHGNRREIINVIKNSGIDVRTWGNGWGTGRISQDEMIWIFNQSRINLNLSNASISGNNRTSTSLIHRILSPILHHADSNRSGKKQEQKSNLQTNDQIKGRNFEVPGCGGFLLTGHADNLEDYYETDKEIVCFDTNEELIEKSRYYLEHEQERTKIAQAGYDRTIHEHTYVHRFNEIFKRMSLPYKTVDIENLTAIPGSLMEIN